MSVTRAQLRTYTYEVLNEPSTSGLYSSDLINLWLNNTQVEVCDGKKLKFLRSTYSFIAPVRTSLTSAITTASTTLAVGDTTNFSTAGAVMVQGDVINYTGKTSTTLTGCTNVGVAHDAGAYVYPLIALPSDYWSTPDVRVYRSTVTSTDTWMYFDELEWNNRLTSHAFTITSDDSGTKYMLVDGVGQGDNVVFHYQKYPTYMDDDADTATIPDPYAAKILPTLTAAKVMLLYGDDLDGLGTKLRQLGEIDLLKMYKHFGMSEEGYRGIFRSQYQSKPRPVFSSYIVRQ